MKICNCLQLLLNAKAQLVFAAHVQIDKGRATKHRAAALAAVAHLATPSDTHLRILRDFGCNSVRVILGHVHRQMLPKLLCHARSGHRLDLQLGLAHEQLWLPVAVQHTDILRSLNAAEAGSLPCDHFCPTSTSAHVWLTKVLFPKRA